MLKVISSSPGDLEPVFEAMLENAVRICGAKFGVAVAGEGEAFRIVAACTELRLPLPNIGRRATLIASRRGNHLERLVANEDSRSYRRPQARAAAADPVGDARLGGARALLNVPMLKDSELVGVDRHLPARGSAIHRQADRAGQEFRRAGRHRHRERAAAQRTARDD